MTTYITDLNAMTLPMADANEYYVDHFDSTLTVFQTIRPEKLNAILNIRAPDTITYEISMSAKDLAGNNVVFRNPIDNSSFIGSQRTGWLLRQGYTPISAGLHTSVRGRLGEDFMQVAGADWSSYFARRQFPFDGSNVLAEAIGGAPHGLAYEATSIDVATILTNILDAVLAKANSWPITYTLAATGISTHWEIPIGDQTFISAMISTLSDIAPGFDFETTWDMVFKIASPYFYGDPTTFDITDPTRTEWTHVFDGSDDAHTPYDLDFTNNGPVSTHISGYGADNSPYIAVTKGYGAGQVQFHRLDASYDFSNIVNRSALDAKTSKQLAFDLQPQHEIPVSVLPSQIVNFWTKFKPGRAIYIDADLLFHEIQSGHRIVSMNISDDENAGEMKVDLGLNQIYSTSDSIGTVEG
jgi:hypothetical protein